MAHAAVENLEVWKRATHLCVEIYKGLEKLREYGYKDQVTRSVLSIASNIAEGYERDGERDRLKFFSYAKGSCAELRTQIHIGMEVGYIDKESGNQWIEETHVISKMLFRFMQYLRRNTK